MHAPSFATTMRRAGQDNGQIFATKQFEAEAIGTNFGDIKKLRRISHRTLRKIWPALTAAGCCLRLSGTGFSTRFLIYPPVTAFFGQNISAGSADMLLLLSSNDQTTRARFYVSSKKRTGFSLNGRKGDRCNKK